jgi:hypothetical protein
VDSKGHWENRRFYKLNQRILRQLGGGWDYPPPLPTNWTTGPLTPTKVEATTLLEDFVDREPWGWKDPRSCLTLPFWQAIIGTIRVVVVVRNPLEVAESLRKRNGFSRALSLALWHSYNQRLLDAVAPSDRFITHYDMYFQDPERELRRLLSFLDLPVDEDIVEQASAAGLSELRHYRLTTRDLVDADDVTPVIVKLYRDLCAEANWQDIETARVVDMTQQTDANPEDRDEPTEPAYSRRQDKRSGVRSPRRPLVQASERIAELEQIVRAQQIALAEHEANARKFQEMGKLVADRTEYAGKVGDESGTLVGDNLT